MLVIASMVQRDLSLTHPLHPPNLREVTACRITLQLQMDATYIVAFSVVSFIVDVTAKSGEAD